MVLSRITEISTGYLFRSRLEPDEAGRYRVIQMKDISEESHINWGDLARISLNRVRGSFLVRRGDILLKAKGSSHTAVLVDRDVRDVIASSHFFILRVRHENVLPGYLAWYLNQKPAQQAIAQVSVGTWMRHVTKESVSNLPVPVPDLETQQKIVYVTDLARRQKQLVDAIQERRGALMNAVLLSAIEDRDTGE